MSSTTHIDKLPTELLEHIFFYYFVDLEKANGLDNILTLTIVSRRWRSTAFCYPYLWSTIQVTESQSDHWRIKVDKWLWRSGDVPLTIDIRDCRTQLITEVITPFLPHSHRWRKLAISEQGYWIEQDEIPQIIPSAPNDPNLPQQLPCLEVLKLGGAYRRIRSLSILRPLHIIAPSLKDLSISDFFLDWAQLRLSADLLTNLNIQVTKHPRPYLFDLMKLIGTITSLRFLELDVGYTRQLELRVETFGSKLVLLQLERFSFTFSGPCLDLVAWITHFDVPNLRSLGLFHRFNDVFPEDTSSAWHVSRETHLRGAFPFLKDTRLPSLLEMQCKQPRYPHCWHSFALLIMAIPSISRLTIDTTLNRNDPQMWEMFSQLQNVKQVHITADISRLPDIQNLRRTIDANPGLRIFFDESEFHFGEDEAK